VAAGDSRQRVDSRRTGILCSTRGGVRSLKGRAGSMAATEHGWNPINAATGGLPRGATGGGDVGNDRNQEGKRRNDRDLWWLMAATLFFKCQSLKLQA
jgi:hypothetical protein